MELFFKIRVEIQKFFANIISAFVRNKQQREKVRSYLHPLNSKRTINYCIKKYSKALPIEEFESHLEEKEYIWQCWLQGKASAPALILRCFESVEKFKKPNQRIIIITADNYQNYVSLPDYIIQKWKQGKIPNAHFSDLLRINLLAKYGGYWIDATCFQLGEIPSEIAEQPFFLYHSYGEFAFTGIQNCFIHSNRNNYIIRKMCGAMNMYWRNEDSPIHYFVFHLMFLALIDIDPLFRSYYQKVPISTDEGMHFLLNAQKENIPFSSVLLKEAQYKCFIQKFTYKFSQEIFEDKKSIAFALSNRGNN